MDVAVPAREEVAVGMKSGRPAWARMMVRFGKSTATSSAAIGSANRLRAPGKIDVPVWIMTGRRASSAVA